MEQPAPASITVVANYQNAQDAIFSGPPVHLARGRQARDPQAKTVSYTVASLDAFESSLREYLDHPPANPDHTDCQLSFWIGTSFLVAAPPDAPVSAPASAVQSQPRFAAHDASLGYSSSNDNNNGNNTTGGGHAQQYGPTYQNVAGPAMALALDFQQPQASPSTANGTGPTTPSSSTSKKAEPKVAMSILEALQPTPDPKEKMRKQRAIAKCCVDAIQKCDGYRYSFHNCWNSREDDSFRFSYYCNDSLLNKDRAANGKGAKLGKRATKPVYDCKGVLSIKFSATKQSLDVFYKHVPVHKTYEERAPPPRKDSRRRKFLEENDPEALKKLQSRPKPSRPDLPLESAQKAKKKRKTDDPKSSTSLESDLRAQSLRSLLELIRPDPGPDHSPPEPPPPPPPIVLQQRPAPPLPPRQAVQQVQQQTQVQQAPQPTTRKRPRNSCDVCKAKKTKCDGTRPICQTCIDKKRQCFYSADQLTEERRPSTIAETTENTRQAQAATNELSELERIRKELEDAKARIQELEKENRRSSATPAQTPQMTHVSQPSRPQLQHQPQSSETPPQAQPHPQQRDQKHQRQHSRSHSLHHQPPKQQPFQHQMPTPQTVPSPQQAMQQLQTAAQQLQTPQHQYPFQNPYGITTQQSMPRNAAQAPQSQSVQQSVQQNVQGHAMGVGGLAPAPEQSDPYARGFNPGEWSGYYGYQSAQAQAQQHQTQQQVQQQAQESQWGGVRGAGVFRQV